MLIRGEIALLQYNNQPFYLNMISWFRMIFHVSIISAIASEIYEIEIALCLYILWKIASHIFIFWVYVFLLDIWNKVKWVYEPPNV